MDSKQLKGILFTALVAVVAVAIVNRSQYRDKILGA